MSMRIERTPNAGAAVVADVARSFDVGETPIDSTTMTEIEMGIVTLVGKVRWSLKKSWKIVMDRVFNMKKHCYVTVDQKKIRKSSETIVRLKISCH